MRITNNMVTRNYTKGLHSNRSLLDKFNNQVLTGRKFDKMSEDTASGVRAMQVRRNLSRVDAYLDNVSAAKSQFTAAEKTLIQVNELSHSASELFVEGISDEKGNDERMAIATEIEKLRDELLSLSNAQFAGRYMFGGTNTVTQPYKVDAEGNLLYNGVDIMSIDSGHSLMDDAAYMDIGLGLNFNDPLDEQEVDPNSAFKTTLVGAEIFGTGKDNLYSLMGEMIDILRQGVSLDNAEAGKILDRFRDSSAKFNLQVTKLGSDYKYLEFTDDRLKSEQLNLKERQTAIEAISPEEAIMNFKVQEYVYNAALQMGQRLLQPTLFSFIS